MSNSIDTDSIAAAVTASSDAIEKTTVETVRDGLNTRLYVRPVLSGGPLTSEQLNAVLKSAYALSRDAVSAIEVRTVGADDKAVDVFTAATELGITHLSNQNSVTYSTVYLAEAYGE